MARIIVKASVLTNLRRRRGEGGIEREEEEGEEEGEEEEGEEEEEEEGEEEGEEEEEGEGEKGTVYCRQHNCIPPSTTSGR